MESEVSNDAEPVSGEDGGLEALNDVRFKDWDEEKWMDNDYIRALRGYIDDVLSGKIKDDDLSPYKNILKSQFIVGGIGPHYFGGVSMSVIFVDMPDRVFDVWVYSYVNKKTEKITSYEVRSVRIEEEPIKNTKEDIMNAVREEPNLKLW